MVALLLSWKAGSSKERHNRDVQQMISEGLDVPIAKAESVHVNTP
jgi:hypothetical protein